MFLLRFTIELYTHVWYNAIVKKRGTIMREADEIIRRINSAELSEDDVVDIVNALRKQNLPFASRAWEDLDVYIDEIIDGIDKLELTEYDLLDIFDALRRQKSFLGGKIWTYIDVYENAYDEAEAFFRLRGMKNDELKKRAAETAERMVKSYRPSKKLACIINNESDTEYESICSEITEKTKEYLKHECASERINALADSLKDCVDKETLALLERAASQARIGEN